VVSGSLRYGVYIMMSRTQLTLDSRLLRRAKARASEFGISLAEYVRRLVARDLQGPPPAVDPSIVFNLGNSGGSDVARSKDPMVAEAVHAGRGSARSAT